jgi:hypothetical protein
MQRVLFTLDRSLMTSDITFESYDHVNAVNLLLNRTIFIKSVATF